MKNYTIIDDTQDDEDPITLDGFREHCTRIGRVTTEETGADGETLISFTTSGGHDVVYAFRADGSYLHSGMTGLGER